jgi:hypothetical protein
MPRPSAKVYVARMHLLIDADVVDGLRAAWHRFIDVILIANGRTVLARRP